MISFKKAIPIIVVTWVLFLVTTLAIAYFVPFTPIGTDKIADDAIVTIKLADGSVTSAKILDETIAVADLITGAVTSIKIANGTVTTSKIADYAVTDIKLAAGAIPHNASILM